MNVYIVEYRDWDEIETREFQCDGLLELFVKVESWKSRYCIHDDSIISIEEA